MENLPGRRFGATCCACVSFVRDLPMVNFVSQTMNYHIKTLVIGGKVYVAWKRKMLHDVIDGHQEYIFMKRFKAHRILQLAKTTRVRVNLLAFVRN